MAYAIQDVAPIVEPGRNTGSILTSAIAVALIEFGGASVDSSGRETSKMIVCGCGLSDAKHINALLVLKFVKNSRGGCQLLESLGLSAF